MGIPFCLRIISMAAFDIIHAFFDVQQHDCVFPMVQDYTSLLPLKVFLLPFLLVAYFLPLLGIISPLQNHPFPELFLISNPLSFAHFIKALETSLKMTPYLFALLQSIHKLCLAGASSSRISNPSSSIN